MSWRGTQHCNQHRPADAGRPPCAHATAIAHLLASVYGHSLDPIVYTLGMGISGRLRLARSTGFPDPAPDIVQLVEPYVSATRPMWNEPADYRYVDSSGVYS